MIALPGIAISILLGWTVVDLATRRSVTGNLIWLRLALAIAAGLGASSLISFACVLAGSPAADRPVELVAACALAAASWRIKRAAATRSRSKGDDRFAMVALTIAALAGSVTFIADSIQNSYGWFDAWAFWMLRARFLNQLGGDWPKAFSRPHHFLYAHLDYPLLYPSVVASAWRDAGSESLILPHLIAGLFLAATVALLVTSVSQLAGRAAGAAAGIMFLSITEMSQVASWLYADVPLACYLLGAVVLMTFAAKEPGSGGLLFLAGLMAGLAPWTKNDGWSVLVATGLALLLMRRAPLSRRLASFGVGLIGPLIALLIFKLRFSPPSDLLRDQNPATLLSRLLDPARYWIIARAAGVYLSTVAIPLAALALAMALFGLRRGEEGARPLLPGTLIVVGVSAIYGAVYLLTPFDLAWHLHTSLSRLALQLWPSLLFLLLLLTGPSSADRSESG